MMAVFRQQVPIVYLSVTTGSHLMLAKKNYLSKGKWEGTRLLNQTRGKETDTWWKVGTWKFADKIWRDVILIILMFSLIFRSSFFSSNVGDSSLRFVSVFLLLSPTCWNFEISMISLHLNTSSIQYMSEIQVSLLSVLFLGSFVGFFEFVISFLHCSKFFISSTFIYFVFYSIPHFTTFSWLFSFHISPSASVCIGVFRTQSNICDGAFCNDT